MTTSSLKLQLLYAQTTQRYELILARHHHFLNMAAPMMATKPSQANVGVTYKPVDLLHSQYATTFSHLHPVLLLSVVILSFSALVADPVSTMLALAPTLAALQFAYCVLCLPPAGQTPQPAPKPGQKKGGKHQQPGISFKIVVRPHSTPPLPRNHPRQLTLTSLSPPFWPSP